MNLTAPFLLARRLGLAMRRRGEGKIINVADVAKTVLFLLEGSDFITGQVVVDGGRSLK